MLLLKDHLSIIPAFLFCLTQLTILFLHKFFNDGHVVDVEFMTFSKLSTFSTFSKLIFFFGGILGSILVNLVFLRYDKEVLEEIFHLSKRRGELLSQLRLLWLLTGIFGGFSYMILSIVGMEERPDIHGAMTGVMLILFQIHVIALSWISHLLGMKTTRWKFLLTIICFLLEIILFSMHWQEDYLMKTLGYWYELRSAVETITIFCLFFFLPIYDVDFLQKIRED